MGSPTRLQKNKRGVPFPHREAPPTPKKKTCFPSLGSPTHPKKTKGDCFSPSLGGPIHFKTASFECLRFTVPAHPIVTLASSSGAALPYRACCLRWSSVSLHSCSWCCLLLFACRLWDSCVWILRKRIVIQSSSTGRSSKKTMLQSATNAGLVEMLVRGDTASDLEQASWCLHVACNI